MTSRPKADLKGKIYIPHILLLFAYFALCLAHYSLFSASASMNISVLCSVLNVRAERVASNIHRAR